MFKALLFTILSMIGLYEYEFSTLHPPSSFSESPPPHSPRSLVLVN